MPFSDTKQMDSKPLIVPTHYSKIKGAQMTSRCIFPKVPFLRRCKDITALSNVYFFAKKEWLQDVKSTQ